MLRNFIQDLVISVPISEISAQPVPLHVKFHGMQEHKLVEEVIRFRRLADELSEYDNYRKAVRIEAFYALQVIPGSVIAIHEVPEELCFRGNDYNIRNLVE